MALERYDMTVAASHAAVVDVEPGSTGLDCILGSVVAELGCLEASDQVGRLVYSTLAGAVRQQSLDIVWADAEVGNVDGTLGFGCTLVGWPREGACLFFPSYSGPPVEGQEAASGMLLYHHSSRMALHCSEHKNRLSEMAGPKYTALED